MGRRANAHRLFDKMQICIGIGIASTFAVEMPLRNMFTLLATYFIHYVDFSLFKYIKYLKPLEELSSPDSFGIQISTSLISTAFRTGSPNN